MKQFKMHYFDTHLFIICVDCVANSDNPLNVGTDSITEFKIGGSGGGANWRCSEVIVFPENTDAYAAAVLSELETDYGL